MYDIPPNHPRYQSLILRYKMAEASKEGILADTALIAHGRGEAFDYILGEKTTKQSLKAIQAAAANLLLAKNPVISVNGNTSVLAAKEIVKLSKIIPAKIEINLFYRTNERVSKIENLLNEAGATEVLGKTYQETVPISGLNGPRSRSHPEGVHKADVILVPLEDGDRAQALVKSGKTVITIDLNPLSRTSQSSSVTIVDNIVRAIPLLIEEVGKLKKCSPPELEKIKAEFDNKNNIIDLMESISHYFSRDV